MFGTAVPGVKGCRGEANGRVIEAVANDALGFGGAVVAELTGVTVNAVTPVIATAASSTVYR